VNGGGAGGGGVDEWRRLWKREDVTGSFIGNLKKPVNVQFEFVTNVTK